MGRDSNLVIKLYGVVKDLDRRTAAICRARGLTIGQFAVLEALYRKGDLSVGRIKETILSSDGTLPVIMRNLQGRGLIRKSRDPQDHRSSIVSLTPEGRTLIADVAPMNYRMLRDRLAVWTKGEQKTLSRLLGRYEREEQGSAQR